MARISAAVAGGLNVIAFLDLLAWSEGTDNGRQPTCDDGYDVLVGGQLFAGYADHPRRLVYLKRLGIRSSAAGRYQLLSRYWDHYRRQLRLEDFGPISQDRVALQQIREQRALGDIQSGRIEDAIAKCCNIWASLPGAGYGQHEHAADDLIAQYIAAGGVLA